MLHESHDSNDGDFKRTGFFKSQQGVAIINHTSVNLEK